MNRKPGSRVSYEANCTALQDSGGGCIGNMSSSMRKPFTLAVIASLLAFNAQADSFTANGYTIGQLMAGCPRYSMKVESFQDYALCNLGPTTFSGEPASSFALVIADGEIIAIALEIAGNDFLAVSRLLEVLKSKYGKPRTYMNDLNLYFWYRERTLMMLDGIVGSLLITGPALFSLKLSNTESRAALPERPGQDRH